MPEYPELISADLRPEAQLLLCCARTQMDTAHTERIITLLQSNLDWTYLLQMASRHNLVPLLYRSLEIVAPAEIPETVQTELKEQIQVDIQGNLFLTKELLHLLALFNQHGILVLPYKGPVLAASVYRDLALRPFNDLDILVHEQDVVQAMDLLISCGYEIIRPPGIARIGKRLQSLSVNQMVENSLWDYQLVLWHPDRHVVVELHWRITPKYIFPYSPEELWDELEPVTLGMVTVLSFTSENLLWFLCVHGAKHQWRRLNWLCDIAELIHAYPSLNWERIITQANKLGIERRLHLGLFLANCLLQTPLPRTIETKILATPHVKVLARQVVERVFDGTEETARFPYFERFAFQLRAMDRMADRGRYLLRFANGIAAACVSKKVISTTYIYRLSLSEDKNSYVY